MFLFIATFAEWLTPEEEPCPEGASWAEIPRLCPSLWLGKYKPLLNTPFVKAGLNFLG